MVNGSRLTGVADGLVRVEGFQDLLDVLLDVLIDPVGVVRLAALVGRFLDDVSQSAPCAFPQLGAALGRRDAGRRRCRVRSRVRSGRPAEPGSPMTVASCRSCSSLGESVRGSQPS